MIIGTFKYDADTDIYSGTITTLALCEKVSLRPNKGASGKEPGYRVISHDSAAEVGAAWARTSENGRKFLSVSIDDPLLPCPLNAALFTNEEGTVGTLIWNRSKSGTKEPAKVGTPSKRPV